MICKNLQECFSTWWVIRFSLNLACMYHQVPVTHRSLQALNGFDYTFKNDEIIEELFVILIIWKYCISTRNISGEIISSPINNGCNYLSMLGLNLINVYKMDRRCPVILSALMLFDIKCLFSWLWWACGRGVVSLFCKVLVGHYHLQWHGDLGQL